MDYEQFDGEQPVDERQQMLDALQVDPPYDPADFQADDTEEVGVQAEEPDQSEPDPRQLLKEREAELERLRAEAEAERGKRSEYEQQVARQQAEQARQQQEAWNRARDEALSHARTLPYDQALQYLAEFSSQREAALMQWGTQLYTEKEVLRWTRQAEKIAAENGLPAEEVETLVRAAQTTGDPATMTAEAKKIKARNSQLEEKVRALEEAIKRQKAESARQKLQKSPINRVGQGNRTAPSNVKKGTREHLAALLG